MIKPAIDKIDQLTAYWLSKVPSMSPRSLKHILFSRFDMQDIQSTFWRMLDEGTIALTSDSKLTLTERGKTKYGY